MANKKRLDQLLVDKQLVENIEKAQRIITSGLVKVNDEVSDKPGVLIQIESNIIIKETKQYVGRGALKILPVIEKFAIVLQDKICADVGSSTGGFTEVLLQKGAQKVYAIDVGYGELDWKLRKDPRVVVMERTNARYLNSLPDKIDFVTIDVSFISLKQIIPSVLKWINQDAHIFAMVKPQFEAEKTDVGEGGIITDPVVHRKVIFDMLNWVSSQNLSVRGLAKAGIEGSKGNQEFFLWLSSQYNESISLDALFKDCF